MATKTAKKPAKAVKPRAPRKPKEKQGYLDPAMAPPHVPAIEDAADDLAASRKARMDMARVEAEQQETLLSLMRTHGLRQYEHGDKLITIVGKEKVSIKTMKEDNGDGDE